MCAPPRYLPERSLPERAFLPGRGAGAAVGRPARVDDAPLSSVPASHWRSNTQYLWGVDLYNGGFFWEAHEAWEGPWHAAQRDPCQRLFLQGLIQCAAACVKVAVGHPASVRRLTERALARLERVHADCGCPYMGLDLARFVPEFRRFAAADPSAPELRPQIWLDSAAPPEAPASPAGR